MTISGGPFLLREGEVGREESLRFPQNFWLQRFKHCACYWAESQRKLSIDQINCQTQIQAAIRAKYVMSFVISSNNS